MSRSLFVAWWAILGTLLPAATCPLIAAPQPKPFGKTASGEPVEIFTLTNQTGMTVRCMTRGATIVDLMVPDRNGKIGNVVLGFDDVAGYESSRNQYFGCTAGRVANRIAGGKFQLNGKTYTLATNNGVNHLHGGGPRSLDKVVWKGEGIETGTGTGVRFTYTSPDGEEGYPGTVQLTVTFVLHQNENQLLLNYRATTDQATPVNLTNHSYFNLTGAGAPTVLDHTLQLHASRYTPTDATLIPTGKLASVAGTPLDFQQPHAIGERIQTLDDTPSLGYDHNYVVSGTPGELRPVARLVSPVSGRVLEVESDAPGVQLYSGNFLSGQAGRAGTTSPRRSAVCLESQFYPDSVNHPEFPDSILKPGNIYEQHTVWRFSID